MSGCVCGGMSWPARCLDCGFTTEDPDAWVVVDSEVEPERCCPLTGGEHRWATAVQALTAERDAALAQVAAVREALRTLLGADLSYAQDWPPDPRTLVRDIIEGSWATTLDALLADTAAAAEAHDEHIRQAERERIEARLSELDECDVLSRYDRGDSGEGGPDVYFSMPAVLAIVEGRTDA